MKIYLTNTQRKELLKFIRTNKLNKKHVPCYSAFGVRRKDMLLPIWYSDSQKLCYPKMYYTESQVEELTKEINKKLIQMGLGPIAKYEPHYIGGFHCSGWCIRIK